MCPHNNKRCAIGALIAFSLASLVHAAEPRTLRVCADPADLPFSNRAGAGFENAIVGVVAEKLDARVEYVWWSQLRGFARKTLGADMCDVWPGVATDLDTMATTEPYYRSSYVFVTRRDRRLDIRSFDDPRLKTLAIGVQMIGNDATNTPPAHALARRGIVTNVRGFMIYDAGADSSPIVARVADGTLDVAIVWGPTAGYFARRANVALAIAPTPKTDAGIPMTFAISMGVRKGNVVLRNAIDEAIRARKPAITQILQRFGVPLTTDGVAAASAKHAVHPSSISDAADRFVVPDAGAAPAP